MQVYRTDRHQITKPMKGVETPDGYEVTSNDGTIRIELRHATVMDGAMESTFYHTVMWIKEGTGWLKVNETQNYRSKDDFLDAISNVEEFSEAVASLKL